MKYIAYIIGHRSADPFRIRNLLLVLKWLLNLKYKLRHVILDIIVVEQDEKPTIKNLISSSIEYIFAYNSGEYNRGWAFNVGYIKFFNYDYYFFADNDIIMRNNDMIHVFNTCCKYDAINPYSEIYDTISKLYDDVASNDVSKILYYSYINNNYVGQKRSNVCFTGGIVGLSWNSVQKISGWDERFRGRGYEDYAMTAKLNLFIPYTHEYNNSAIHIWHPWDNSNKIDNESLHVEYSHYTVDDYLKLINDTYNNYGCVNKYINETPTIVKYNSNEPNNAKNYTHKKCYHCKYMNGENKHNYLDGYKIYNKLVSIIRSKHSDISEEELIKLIYFNLYDRYNCILNCDTSGNTSRHSCDIDPPS